MPNHLNKSERLFQEFCQLNGIACTRLPELGTERQPDFELMVSGHRVVAEVKQIDPNEEDRKYSEALRREKFVTRVDNPDYVARRIREDIRDSRSQINSYLERVPGTPAILVIYDDTDGQYTDINNILVVMHGWEQVVFGGSKDGSAPQVIERGFGPRNNSTIRHDHNQQLSALVTLHERWNMVTHERILSASFYHHRFAHYPFNPDWLRGDRVTHYDLGDKVRGEFQNWVEI